MDGRKTRSPDRHRGSVTLVVALSGKRLVGIPWLLIQADSGDQQQRDNALVARIEVSMFENAPSFGRTEALGTVDLEQWAFAVFKHFDLEPKLVEGKRPGAGIDAPPGP
jgi:hypothetical protein